MSLERSPPAHQRSRFLRHGEHSQHVSISRPASRRKSRGHIGELSSHRGTSDETQTSCTPVIMWKPGNLSFRGCWFAPARDLYRAAEDVGKALRVDQMCGLGAIPKAPMYGKIQDYFGIEISIPRIVKGSIGKSDEGRRPDALANCPCNADLTQPLVCTLTTLKSTFKQQ